MASTYSAMNGFRVKTRGCRLIECNGGICMNNCPHALHVNHLGQAGIGSGAGDGAYLPSGEPGAQGGPDDFLVGVTAWAGGSTARS